jgi:hypothetical protein
MRAMRGAAVVVIFEVEDRRLHKWKETGTKVVEKIERKVGEVYMIFGGKTYIYGFWTRFLIVCQVTKSSQSETLFSHPKMGRHIIGE